MPSVITYFVRSRNEYGTQISLAVWNQSIEKVNNSIKPVSENAWENLSPAIVLFLSAGLLWKNIKINRTEKKTQGAHKKSEEYSEEFVQWNQMVPVQLNVITYFGSHYTFHTPDRRAWELAAGFTIIISGRTIGGISKGSPRLVGPASAVNAFPLPNGCWIGWRWVARPLFGFYPETGDTKWSTRITMVFSGALKDHVDVFESIGFRQLNCMNSINIRDWLSELDALPLFGHYSAIASLRNENYTARLHVELNFWDFFLRLCWPVRNTGASWGIRGS